MTISHHWKSKLLASGMHLGISALIFTVLMALVAGAWFPGMHYWADGGWQGTKLLAGVDLVLGPFLTFVVYNASKSIRERALDLSIVALIQLIALVWGVNQVYSQRIAGTAFLELRIFPVQVAQLLEQEGVESDVMNALSDDWPPHVFSRAPSFKDGSFKVFAKYLSTPRHSHAHLMAPWQENFAKAKKSGALKLQNIVDDFPKFSKKLNTVLKDTGLRMDEVYAFEYHGRYERRVLLFDESGNFVKVLPYFDPALKNEGPEFI